MSSPLRRGCVFPDDTKWRCNERSPTHMLTADFFRRSWRECQTSTGLHRRATKTIPTGVGSEAQAGSRLVEVLRDCNTKVSPYAGDFDIVDKMNEPCQNHPLPKSSRTKFMEEQKNRKAAGSL